MPRIDPLQLLKCLQVLLTKDGGVLANEEVQRLASLMTKFSKKLVSKCVYVLILKNTENSLLSAFMSAGGWQLIYVWLQDGTYAKNWPLVKELLELLLLCPVDVERLKSNNIPKLVKSISKREDLAGLYDLANQLVERWLKIVKSETVAQQLQQKDIVLTAVTTVVTNAEPQVTQVEVKQNTSIVPEENNAIAPTVFYKISSIKDGRIIAKISSQNENVTTVETNESIENNIAVSEAMKVKKDDEKKNYEKSNHDRSKTKSSSSSRSSSSSKEKSSSRDKSSRDKDRRSSSSRDKSSRDKERSKDRDKDKSRSNGSHKSSSKSSSSSSGSSSNGGKDKEKQAEKDKATLLKVQPPSLNKLGRIPKKPSSSDEKKKDDKKVLETTNHKKPSISIEVRSREDGRPKTVKVYNAKMRSTGLEETAKPPPPRSVSKKSSSSIPTSLPSIPTKRPSPTREPLPPPEKRTKVNDVEDKPGAIKLIAAKPKRVKKTVRSKMQWNRKETIVVGYGDATISATTSVLQESDLFMDILTASATSKKEPRKRKRRLSSSKDGDKPSSPPASPTVANNAASSPLALKNISAPKFYQDTLEEESPAGEEPNKKNDDSSEIESERDREVTTPTEAEEIGPAAPDENVVKETDGLKGVLVYLKRKGPKKSLKWKTDTELVEVKYFELDETERVNVTKTFTDMKQFDISSERQAFMHRKINADDVMDEKTSWRIPIPIDCTPYPAQPGSKSLEKDIQFAREKTVLQALCFNKAMLPDSPAEPDPEVHPMTDPVLIPLDDDNPDLVTDHTGKPWPEPKGSPPEQTLPIPVGIPGPPFVNAGMPPGGFPPQGIPPFGPPAPFNLLNMNMAPNMIGGPGGGDWNNMNGQMPPMNMPPNMGPDMMNQGPPSIFGAPPDAFNNMMNDASNNFGPPQGFNPPGMFHNNFGPNRGNNRGNFRGRGGGNAPWFRMNGPPQGGWHGNQGGPPRGGGAGNNWMGRGVCKNVRNHGFCRQRDTCPFMHPNNVGRNN